MAFCPIAWNRDMIGSRSKLNPRWERFSRTFQWLYTFLPEALKGKLSGLSIWMNIILSICPSWEVLNSLSRPPEVSGACKKAWRAWEEGWGLERRRRGPEMELEQPEMSLKCSLEGLKFWRPSPTRQMDTQKHSLPFLPLEYLYYPSITKILSNP